MVPSPYFNDFSKNVRNLSMCQNPYTLNVLCFSNITRSFIEKKNMCGMILVAYLSVSTQANSQWSLSFISFSKCSNQCFTNHLWWWTSLFFFFFFHLSWTETFVKYNKKWLARIMKSHKKQRHKMQVCF